MLDGWLEHSTKVSGVPLKVADSSVLLDIAALIPHSSA